MSEHEPQEVRDHRDGSTTSIVEIRPSVNAEALPPPQPLSANVKPERYPLDALPETIRAAIVEAHEFIQAPVPLVASSALAALSLAVQAHADVRRADTLEGPSGLFMLAIAESGERKTTCDRYFMRAIREYEQQQSELMKPELEKHRAELAAWIAKRDGLTSAIKMKTQKSQPTEEAESKLEALQHDEPQPVRVPRLLLGDITPEKLAHRLATEWPSAGVVSSEAGTIFGSHGMGADVVMRNLALLNTLWDGEPHRIDRRTSESFTVKGARLTVALQVQAPTLREFFKKSGDLARGTGFLARFLIAWPQSTQGARPYKEPPNSWPCLSAFEQRLTEILDKPAPITNDGALEPTLLDFTPEAKTEWIKYHNEIERELASGGELYDVRDVASKSADNAARLAALFQVFEHGPESPISLAAFKAASRLAAWHLRESRRFFGELALPAELADAARLDAWLIEHCRRERTQRVGKNYVRQHGPNPLRNKDRLDAAIHELDALDRVSLVQVGKKQTVYINPALLKASS